MNDVPDVDSKTAANMAALVERFARRYAADGYTHPRVAAAVVTARGHSGATREAFARSVGVDAEHLTDAESGLLSMGALREPLRNHLRRLGLTTD